MSQSPCIYVLNKQHPQYASLLTEIDWVLSDEYADVIEARLQSMRGLTTVMYLGDRFVPYKLNAFVGEWVDVRKQIESDIECFLAGKLPDDLAEGSFTALLQPHHGNTAAYQRRNEQGDLELVTELVEFLQEVSESKISETNLAVVRSWW